MGYHRREANDPIDTRITQQRYDAVGRLIASRDPYLFDLAQTDDAAPFNLNQVLTLSATALLTESVDAGWRLGLSGEAGQSLETWDGRGSRRRIDHDELLRPVALREAGTGIAEQVIERFTYADAGPEAAAHNLCGQLVRHDDPAGTVLVQEAGLSGLLLKHTRQFLKGTEAPDWPLAIADRDALLEPDNGMTTANTYAASGEALSQTDAMGNIQSTRYTRAGQLKDTRVTLTGAGQSEKLLVTDLHYNAMGQIEAETAGNGVVTRHRYDEANGRLTELSAHKSDGTPLQQLQYAYDAVGNVLSIEDAAQPIRYFNNQRIEPIKTYRYDTLNQLIEATGSEAVSGNGGPALPDLQPLPVDPSQIANYTQTFHYDSGGNLLDLVHVGAQSQGRTLTRAKYSNRCLPERDGRPPTEAELAAGFDANGNLQELQPGQRLVWDLRNQLREVKPVVREDADDDRECYVYDSSGQRVRKVHSSVTNARTILREVRYLPGLEIRSHGGTREILHVINASAGSNSVQILHWLQGLPDEVPQNQLRYSLNDHLKSNTIELDQHADLIGMEWYYAFGGTALRAGRNIIEAEYKTLGYSGKECDGTGLVYYGFRYYAPWLARWINPDPAGDVDGLNRFRMVRNNPIAYFDPDGLAPPDQQDSDDPADKLAASFFNPTLQMQFDSTSDAAKARFEFVKNRMKHTRESKAEFYSAYKNDEFGNTFRKGFWLLEHNFRPSKTTRYYASDVLTYQYLEISKSNGFFGHLPSMIGFSHVINEATLRKTKHLENKSEALFDYFMDKTPIGKSLKRSLDFLGMEAVGVERQHKFEGKHEIVNYVVHIAPTAARPDIVRVSQHSTTATKKPSPVTQQDAGSLPGPSSRHGQASTSASPPVSLQSSISAYMNAQQRFGRSRHRAAPTAMRSQTPPPDY
ncbi:RHS repeat domain-containing protein [Pseudomonas sp. MYb118]|uniref:RHS repeat domain-containing protein n=1 Tax=Pseudomonas sp. MYb118 TaxID=1848720 RepID=UPI0034CEE646